MSLDLKHSDTKWVKNNIVDQIFFILFLFYFLFFFLGGGRGASVAPLPESARPPLTFIISLKKKTFSGGLRLFA